MSRQSIAAKSVSKTLSSCSWRSTEPPLISQEPDSKSSRVPAWRKLAIPPTPTESSEAATGPIPKDEETFQTIPIRSKSIRQGSERYDLRRSSILHPPSAAAISRAAPYASTRPHSIYNPSHDPSSHHHLRSSANRSVKLPKSHFKPGMIIRAPLHEQDFKGGKGTSIAGSNATAVTAAADEKYTTESRFGPIFTKYRKMIVVAMHEDNYVAVPLYTHNGKGLKHKTAPDEFVSIRDHRLQDHHDQHGGWSKLSKWDPLVTEYVRDGIDVFDRMSTAHLAYPVSRKYVLPVVHEGQLRATSLRMLVELFAKIGGVGVV
ncbi:MAG: hypothetical protein Q9190_008005 [Brigantiaea leucoxantha]